MKYPAACRGDSLLFCFAESEANPPKAALAKPEITLDGGSLFGAPTPFHPLYLLRQAIQDHAQITIFHVTWNASGSHDTNTSHLLYNKKQQILIYQNDSQSWPDPLDKISNSKAKREPHKRHRLKWNHVSPAVLKRLFNEANHQSYLFKRGDLNTINDCDELIKSLTKFSPKMGLPIRS